MESRLRSLVSWVRETAEPSKGLVIPVSGGSDSALCFWICRQAWPDKTIAVHAGRELRSKEWLEKTGAVEYTIAPGEHDEREEMRWARFLSMSLAKGYWLVGSRNRTEDELGTYSLASRIATYLPLVGVWKSEVLAMCRHIGVPEEVIASSLRADPDCGRPAELAEIPYETIESFLKGEMHEKSVRVDYLENIRRRNAFKKKLPARGPFLPS